MADRLYIDFETRSTADLKKTGAWRYAEDPSTGVFCMAWAFNNEPTDIWIEGQPLPDRIRQHVEDGGEVHAWNAMFELAIWTRICAPRFGWPKLFISQMRDTMAAAAYWGLPLSLDMAAQASGARVQKDSAGHKLMQKLCKPRQGGTWWHEDDPSLLPGLYRYCENDVDTERAIAATIPDLPDAEQRVWEADMTINMRGVMLDMRLVNKLKAFTDWEKTELDKRMNQLTNGRATACTQTARILAFVQENNPHVTSLTKEAVEEALSGTLTPVAREVLELRQASAKSSTSKLNAMLACVCADGRVRGLLQYYGANRTGRWAGRLVQVQNLPRPTTKRVSEIIDMVLDDATPDEVGLFINPLDAVASIIRGCFAATPGKKFFQQDLSQIEARVVAWLSGQDDILDVFARGEDVYVYTAQKMGSNDRQLGKVLVLACISEGELVLTEKHGLVPIEKITTEMRVWDGVEWVSHDGVVCRGEKEVIEYDGLIATHDHIVWTEDGRQISFGRAASQVVRLARTACGGTPLRYVEGVERGIREEERLSFPALPVHSLRHGKAGVLGQPAAWKDERLSLPVEERAACSSHPGTPAENLQMFDGCQEPLHEPQAQTLGELRRQGHSVSVQYCDGSHVLGGPQSREAPAENVSRQDRQQRTLCSGKSAVGNPEPADAELPQARRVKVYDIVNAGPRHRFTVSGRLVHNCGFGMGWSKFQATARTYRLYLADDEAETAVLRWRKQNPAIVSYWKTAQEACVWAIRNPGRKMAIGPKGRQVIVGVSNVGRTRGHLLVQLPSGRYLVYRDARLEQGKYGPEITYMGVNQYTRKWERLRTYGGKLVENWTQAVARDVQAEATVNIEAQIPGLVMSVHDELINENDDASGMAAIMNTPPVWAGGLPVTSDGWVGDRYRK